MPEETQEQKAERERNEALAKLREFVDGETAGLRKNRDDLKAEKTQLSDRLRELEEKWGNLDPEQVRALMDKLENDEEAKLIAEGKVDEVLERRTEALRTDYEGKLTAAHARIDELDAQLGGRKETIKRLTIDSQIRELGLGMETPIQAKALNDAIRAGREIFTLDEKDNVVALKDGAPIIGKDGKTPLGIGEWLQTTFDAGSTLWWGASSGGGATGGGDQSSEGLDQETVSNMSPRAKIRAGLSGQAA